MKKQLSGAICAVLLGLALPACTGSKPEEKQETPSTKAIDETRYVDPSKPAEKPPEPGTMQPAGSAVTTTAGSAAPNAPSTTAAGSAATPPAGSAAPTAAGADLPKECADYKAMVDKMNACEKFGAQKAKLAETFSKSWDAWNKLPADGKAKLAAECKKSADTIKSVGAAACGW